MSGVTDIDEVRIQWPTNLSSLKFNEFRIDVRAYTKGEKLIASNYELFCVDQCDGDWVVH